MSKYIFYCGPTPEQWTPESLNKGLGGSESALIGMAKHLAENNEVIVYNDSEGGEWDKVKYINYDELKEDECDILIIWRNPSYIKDIPIKAKKKYLWLHDMIPEVEVLPFIYIYDKVMVLSEFHRLNYQNIPDERIMITRNAFDKLEVAEKRDPNMMIYASNYDRGLKIILENWTTIKSQCPDAQLTVAYGWETLNNLAESTGEQGKEAFDKFKEYIENLLNQDGIRHLGRVSKLELAKEFARANLWVYPCIYPEVSCISAMEAQTYGAVPIVFASGALPETVQYGKVLGKSGEVTEKEFVDSVIKFLKDQKRVDRIRKVMRVDFSYDALVKEWENEFQS